MHLAANTVVKGVEDVFAGCDGEDSGDVGGCASELEVIVDSLFEEGKACGLDILKLLKLELVLIFVEPLINHSHNTKVVGVIGVTKLTLVKRRTELQRDIILTHTEQ